MSLDPSIKQHLDFSIPNTAGERARALAEVIDQSPDELHEFKPLTQLAVIGSALDPRFKSLVEVAQKGDEIFTKTSRALIETSRALAEKEEIVKEQKKELEARQGTIQGLYGQLAKQETHEKESKSEGEKSSALSKELDAIREELSKSESSVAQGKREVMIWMDISGQRTGDYNAVLRKFEAAEAKVKKLESEIEGIRREKTEKEQECDELSVSVESLKSQIEKLEKKAAPEREAFEIESKSEVEKSSALSKELASRKIACGALEEKLRQKQEQIRILSSQLKECGELKETVENYKKDHANKVGLVRECENTIKFLEKSLNVLRAEKQSQETKLELDFEESKGNRNVLRILDEELQEKLSENKSLKEDQEVLEDQVEELEDSFNQEFQERKQLSMLVEQKDKKIQELTSRLENLGKAYSKTIVIPAGSEPGGPRHLAHEALRQQEEDLGLKKAKAQGIIEELQSELRNERNEIEHLRKEKIASKASMQSEQKHKQVMREFCLEEMESLAERMEEIENDFSRLVEQEKHVERCEQMAKEELKPLQAARAESEQKKLILTEELEVARSQLSLLANRMDRDQVASIQAKEDKERALDEQITLKEALRLEVPQNADLAGRRFRFERDSQRRILLGNQAASLISSIRELEKEIKEIDQKEKEITVPIRVFRSNLEMNRRELLDQSKRIVSLKVGERSKLERLDERMKFLDRQLELNEKELQKLDERDQALNRDEESNNECIDVVVSVLEEDEASLNAKKWRIPDGRQPASEERLKKSPFEWFLASFQN